MSELGYSYVTHQYKIVILYLKKIIKIHYYLLGHQFSLYISFSYKI